MSNEMKELIDWTAVAALLGVLAQLITPLASLATFIWMCFRIYEMCTVQRIIHKSQCRPKGDDN